MSSSRNRPVSPPAKPIATVDRPSVCSTRAALTPLPDAYCRTSAVRLTASVITRSNVIDR